MSNFSDQENFNIVAPEGDDVEGHLAVLDGGDADKIAVIDGPDGDDVEGHLAVLDGRDSDKIALIDGPDGEGFVRQ